MTTKANTMTTLLNADVELTLLKAKGDTSHVENMVAAVNGVNWTAELIKEYVDGFASAVLAAGMSKDSVKVLKSNRKCILEFSAGLRKGQEDKAFWTDKACKKMAVELGTQAPDISGYAKACRKALQDEAPEKEFNFKEKLEKLVIKACEEGYTPEEIEFAMKLVMNPEAALDAAA